MKKLKLNLITHPGSTKRGIGIYSQNLKDNLRENKDIVLTDKNPDITHFTFFDLFYPSLPITTKTPSVVTIHDLTPLALPHLYPKGFRSSLNLMRQWLSLQSIKAVVTDSKNSKKDIEKYLRVPKKKIHVVPLASDPEYAKTPPKNYIKKIAQKYNLPKQFILYVGGVNPNKNLTKLVEVAQDLLIPLVLVGSEFTKPIPQNKSIKSLIGLQSIHPELKDFKNIKEIIDESDIIYTPGFVSKEELAAIYRLATMYCQPSLYEGFGLPLLEAMSAECLIITSNSSSLPEVYPKGTINFNPESPVSIKKAINKALNLTSAQRRKLIEKGKEKASKFTWEKTTDQTIKIYQSILK